jgi:hypothetical protein
VGESQYVFTGWSDGGALSHSVIASASTTNYLASFATPAAPSFLSVSSATFTVGTFGTFAVTTSGTPTPALSYTGSLPSGVTFVDNHNGTATLSGTPNVGTAAVYQVTFVANNGAGNPVSQSFTLTVENTQGGLPPSTFGFDFRATTGYVMDPSYAAPVTGETFPHTYTNGAGATISAGFVGGSNVSCQDSSTTVDPRLAGVCYNSSSNGSSPYYTTFEVTLPATGATTISLAAGQNPYPQSQYITLLDNGVPFAILPNIYTNPGTFSDATGTVYAAGSWPSANTPITHTFTSTTFTIQIGSTSPEIAYTTLAYLAITQATTPPSTLDLGFDFRATSGYVADPSYAVPVLGETFPHTYTNGVGATISAGFVGGNVTCVNRSASIDPRLTGACYNTSGDENSPPTSTLFTVTLPSAGSWTISLAAGDASYPQEQYITLLDNGIAFAVYDGENTAAGSFMDAYGSVYTAASWPTSHMTFTHIFTGTTFSIEIGPTTAAGTGGLATFLSFLQINQASP